MENSDRVEHLSLREANNEIIKLENKIDLYLTKKKINYIKTQPGAIRYKDVITSKTNNVFDKFTHYVIKDEELDETLFALTESLLAYQQFVVKEMKRMSQYDEISLICYLKEEENLPWKEIDKLLVYGEGYSRVKYNRYKKKHVNSN